MGTLNHFTLVAILYLYYLAAAFPLNTAIIPRLISPYSASTQQREQVFSEGVHLPHAAICHLPTLLPTLTHITDSWQKSNTYTYTHNQGPRPRATMQSGTTECNHRCVSLAQTLTAQCLASLA